MNRHHCFRHIDDLRIQNIAGLHDIPAVAFIIFDLDKHELPADAVRLVKCFDFDDIQLFIKLLLNLLDGPLIPGTHDRHAGNGRIVGLSHCK